MMSLKDYANVSGITKHARHCQNGVIDWENPEIIAIYSEKSKKSLQKNLLIRESLEIRRQKTSQGQGLNDPQLCVRSNAWNPILQRIEKH